MSWGTEWSKLKIAQQAVVRQCVEEVSAPGEMKRIAIAGTPEEAYAYQHPGGGTTLEV